MARLPLDITVLQWFRNRRDQPFVTVATHRRSLLDLSAYTVWMARAIDICVGFRQEYLPVLSGWTRRARRARRALNGIRPCLPPPKVDVPRIALGHLLSADVFGDEDEVPLYYIQIVQGASDAVKVLISSSKMELVESAYTEACLGHSTVFVGGICQSACQSARPTIFGPRCDMTTRRNVDEAVEMLAEAPSKVAIIY